MEIDDIHLRHCMLYEFNQKSKAAQAVRNICSVYGKEMVKERTCQRWFSKFRAGDFNLEDKPRSGNTGKVDLDELQKIIGGDNRLSTQKIAEKMNLSRSTVDRNLHKIGFAYVENEWIYKGKTDDLINNEDDPPDVTTSPSMLVQNDISNQNNTDMFVISELKDTIRIAPELFHLNLVDAIRDEINRKLANKVLINVGLCITLKDIVKLSDSLILPGDGASHSAVVFRYVVFRPQIGDIIVGKIRNISREGVHVTLGFFDDILIPPSAMQNPSRFDETEQAWVWEYPLENDEKHDLYMDVGEPIRFRVSGEVFEESSPIGPPTEQPSTSQAQTGQDVKTPYRITAAINESGLGLLSWWISQNAPEDDGGDDVEVVEDEMEEEGEYE